MSLFSQSQRSTQRESYQSQQQFSNDGEQLFAYKTNSYISEDPELSKKADECVQYILFCCLSENKAIVKRTDLNKNIIKDLSRQYKSIIKLVDKRLKDVFGIELVELDIIEKSEKHGIRAKYEYDLSLNQPNILENNYNDQLFNDQFKYSMIMISLSLIFMNDNEIDSEIFWDILKRLDINSDEKKHKYLGDVTKYFTVDLVKDGYLECDKIVGIEPPTYKFKAGYRSKLEITKKSILEFVCNIYGGLDVCRPEEWSTQYADALKESENNEDGVSEMETNSQQNEVMATTQTQRSQRAR